MALTLLVVFGLLLPKVSAVQLAVNENENDVRRSFVSKNKLFCAEAELKVAIDALHLFKSMPRGKLFDGTMLNLHTMCSDWGYKVSAGEDPCYPGLYTFYRNKEEGDRFFVELQNHLKVFGESKNATLEDAQLMDTCNCHSKSYAKNNVMQMLKKSCDSLHSTSSNALRSFVSKNKLFCAQAKQTVADDALQLFKSMPRGKLFDGAMLRLKGGCSDYGYKVDAGEDPCYPGLQTFYRNKKEGEHFFRELANHLNEFGASKNVTLEDAQLMDTCNCHSKSYAKVNVGKLFKKSCDTVLESSAHK